MAKAIASFLRSKKFHSGKAAASFPCRGSALSVLAALGHLSQRERQGVVRTAQLYRTDGAVSVLLPIGMGDTSPTVGLCDRMEMNERAAIGRPYGWCQVPVFLVLIISL